MVKRVTLVLNLGQAGQYFEIKKTFVCIMAEPTSWLGQPHVRFQFILKALTLSLKPYPPEKMKKGLTRGLIIVPDSAQYWIVSLKLWENHL